MAGSISWRIETKDNGRINLRLEQLPDLLRDRLAIAIEELTDQLLARVIAAEPSRRGTLRAMTHSYVDKRANWVRGRVRVLRSRDENTAAAAGALEYGGPSKNPHIARGIGRGGSRRRGKRGGGSGGKVAVASYRRGGIAVREYERRRPTRRARMFLRGPARAYLPMARARLEAAINEGLKLSGIN